MTTKNIQEFILEEAAKKSVIDLVSGILSTSISTEAKRTRIMRIVDDLTVAVEKSRE